MEQEALKTNVKAFYNPADIWKKYASGAWRKWGEHTHVDSSTGFLSAHI